MYSLGRFEQRHYASAPSGEVLRASFGLFWENPGGGRGALCVQQGSRLGQIDVACDGRRPLAAIDL